MKIETAEKLKEIFNYNECPYFFLKKAGSREAIVKNTTIADLEKSWEKLQKGFSMLGDGDFTIEFRSSPTQSRGSIKIEFSKGNATSSTSANGIGNIFDPKMIGSLGATAGNLGIFGIEYLGMKQQAQIQNSEIMNLKLENQRLQFENQRLEEELNQEPQEKSFIHGLLETHLGKILDKFPDATPAVAAIGVQKAKGEVPTEAKEGEVNEEHAQRLTVVIQRLMKVFKSKSYNDFLDKIEKLATFAEKNAKMVNGFLNDE